MGWPVMRPGIYEQRRESLAYAILKPFGLSLLSALAAMLLALALINAVRAMGRHAWLVTVAITGLGHWAWTVIVAAKYDDRVGAMTHIAGFLFAGLAAMMGFVLDQLIVNYWNELLWSVLPVSGTLVFFITIIPANTMEAWLVSPELERAAGQVAGGHEHTYEGPWFMRWLLEHRRRQPDSRPLPQLNVEVTKRDEYGRLRQILHHLRPPVSANKFLSVARRVLEGKSYSEASLCGNGKPLKGRDELDGLREWFIKYGFADWKTRREDGTPVKQQSIIFTDEGVDFLAGLLEEADRPTPLPE